MIASGSIMVTAPGTLKLNALPYAAAFWLIIIVGNVLPLYTDEAVPLGMNSVIAALFLGPILLRADSSGLNKPALITLYLFLVVLILGLIRTGDITYAIGKIDSSIITSLLIALVAIEGIRRHGIEATCKAMCLVLAGLLVLTLIYKLHYGFFDRTVRFFLNGPIVFSWLMGVFAILSLYLATNEGHKLYYAFFVSALLAVFWSMSKGPLLALVATLAFYFLRHLRGGQLFSAFLMIGSAVFVVLHFLGDMLLNSRYMAIFRFSSGDDVDQGSVGARMGMWKESLEIAYENPIFGVGLANWQFHTEHEFFYPHNFVLELASEMGVIVTTFALVAIASASWTVRNHVFFPVVIFLLACLLFSGDLTYLRYPLAFLIAAYCTINLCRRESSY